ncbi:GTP-binding protein [Actinomadura welshii]
MVSGPSSDGGGRRAVRARRLPTAVKIVIAGGFGVGKTTMVGTVSETRPLRTEEILTDKSVGVDDISGVERKDTTTVAMDFGRITMKEDYVLYLFGTPGQQRFWFMWDEVSLGALGAVVLADTRRLSDCFPSVDYFERRNTPFVVAVNCFEGAKRYDLEEIQMALNLGPKVPVMLCDARNLESCKAVLIDLVLHAMKTRGVTEEPEPQNA